MAQTSAGVPNWAAPPALPTARNRRSTIRWRHLHDSLNSRTAGWASSEEEQKVIAAEAAVANAESTKRPSDVAAAKTKVDAVGDAGKKVAFQARFDAVVNLIFRCSLSLHCIDR